MKKKLLVPTRGGERSYLNQDRAIQIAKELGGSIIFLYITDVEFLNKISGPINVDIASELDHMGEFLLIMAKERAEKEDVEAETLVRRGVFRDALIEVITEKEIETLILGSSDPEAGVTTSEMLENLSQGFVDKTGVEVIILLDGEIVEKHK